MHGEQLREIGQVIGGELRQYVVIGQRKRPVVGVRPIRIPRFPATRPLDPDFVAFCVLEHSYSVLLNVNICNK